MIASGEDERDDEATSGSRRPRARSVLDRAPGCRLPFHALRRHVDELRDAAVAARLEARGLSGPERRSRFSLIFAALPRAAQVVQLRAADVTAVTISILSTIGVARERRSTPTPKLTLRTVKVPGCRHRAPDDDPLEDLDPGPVSLDDPDVHLHGVTGAEGGDVVRSEAASRLSSACIGDRSPAGARSLAQLGGFVSSTARSRGCRPPGSAVSGSGRLAPCGRA